MEFFKWILCKDLWYWQKERAAGLDHLVTKPYGVCQFKAISCEFLT